MGLFSLVGGLLGGGKAKKASRRAEEAQLEYLQRALDIDQSRYAQAEGRLDPFVSSGTSALSRRNDLAGVNGDPTRQSSLDALRESPFYKTLFRNGEEAVLQNASATGGLRGGNTQRSLAEFGEDAFARTLDRELSILDGLSQQGLGAAGSLSGFGAQSAANQGNLFANQGQVRAGGLLTRGGITQGQFANIGAFADSAAASFLPGGGGFKGLLKKAF